MDIREDIAGGAVSFQQEGHILAVTFHAPVSDADFDFFLRRMTANLERGAKAGIRVGTIIETRKAAGNTPTSQRRKQAEWLAANNEMLTRHSAGTAFVFDSMLSRFVLSSILLLQKMPTEYTVVATTSEAIRWCRARLR